MRFKYFKSKVHSMLKDGELMDEQTINDFYTAYREDDLGFNCAEWIEFWFADWTMEKHGFELHSKLNKK